MLRPARIFFGIFVLTAVLAAVPLSQSLEIKSQSASFLKGPLLFSSQIASRTLDLIAFMKNADRLRALTRESSKAEIAKFDREELVIENERLTRLLNLKKQITPGSRNVIFSRVIGRSASSWNRACLIDKGSKQGIRLNMAVLSEHSLVGKIIECGPSVSKVLFITDPSSKIGVVVGRTRQHGVLYGTPSGQCRVKYLSIEQDIKPGDEVMTAGFGNVFPKGLRIGALTRAWKEPGQIYQVAELKPASDLSTIEEVICVQ